jgi:hypothetical protein
MLQPTRQSNKYQGGQAQSWGPRAAAVVCVIQEKEYDAFFTTADSATGDAAALAFDRMATRATREIFASARTA